MYRQQPLSVNSPSAARRYARSRRHSVERSKPSSSEKELRIETTTKTKKVSITWNINKQTIDVAKLSSKGEKKGVIETSVKYETHRFNLELCVPGWRRSQDGFSAFYLTVPRISKMERKRLRLQQLRQRRRQQMALDTHSDHDEDEEDEDEDDQQLDIEHDDDDDLDNESDPVRGANQNDEENDFVARYTVSFGDKQNKRLSRKSSIRNDFDLGVGFPNFAEVSTLMDSICGNSLEFNIEVEIFWCQSTISDRRSFIDYPQQNPQSVTSKFFERMYRDKLHSDVIIVTNCIDHQSGHNLHHHKKQAKQIKIHKCVLTAASPVFHTFFKHNSKENMTSSIVMNQWNINTIVTMIKFLYLGKIKLFHPEMEQNEDNDMSEHRGLDEEDDDDDDDQSDHDEKQQDDDQVFMKNAGGDDQNEEVKCEEDEEDECSFFIGTDKYGNDELRKLESQCPESARRLFAVFQIAECYEITALSNACCFKLVQYITVSTCCLFLLYLDKYSEADRKMKSIKEYILEFIVKNIHSVQKSKGYKYLLNNKPDLLNALIGKIAADIRHIRT